VGSWRWGGGRARRPAPPPPAGGGGRRGPPPPPPRSFREQTAAVERAKEEKLIAQFLAKCAADDAKEALARKAREAAIERFKAEVAAQRDVRQQLFAAQKLAEVRAAEEAAKADEFKRRVVAAARRRLLEEHAAVLRGFLPRGVITSNADLDILKAFDGNRDGVLSEAEMDLAQAAFRAYDPGAARAPAAGGGGAGGGGGVAGGGGGGAAGGGGGAAAPAVPPLPVADAAARNRRANNASSVSFA